MDRTTPQRRSVSRKAKCDSKSYSPTAPSSSHLASKTCSALSPEPGREVEEVMAGRTTPDRSSSGTSFQEETSGTEAPILVIAPTTQSQSQTGFRPSIVENVAQVSPSLSRWIKQQAQSLTLCQADRQRAAELVNHLREGLLNFLKGNNEQPYFRSVTALNTGSYYEMVKVNNPNEFDMMLVLPTPRLDWTELKEYRGLYYNVSLIRPTRSDLQAFLVDDGLTISAPRILNEMRRLVIKFLRTYRAPELASRWVLSRKRPNSPAVTLVLMEKQEDDQVTEELLSLDIVPAIKVPKSQGWPVATHSGLEVENWLGKKARRDLTSQAFYFVPKRPGGRNLSDAAKESWRISFSHIEKEIIRNHGQSKTCCERSTNKCCRKSCLKLLKRLIEGLKMRFPQELDSLCSYHGKTTFLHTLSTHGQDSLWAPSHLPGCFMTLLLALEDHACRGELPHFFIPAYNLFAAPVFPRRALSCLREALQEQRRLGLPLLQLPSPPPPLTLNLDTPQPLAHTQTEHSKVGIMASIVALVCILSVVAFTLL